MPLNITHESNRTQMTSSRELSLFHPSFVEIPRRLRRSFLAVLASLKQTESFHWSASTHVYRFVVHKAALTTNQSHLYTLHQSDSTPFDPFCQATSFRHLKIMSWGPELAHPASCRAQAQRGVWFRLFTLQLMQDLHHHA